MEFINNIETQAVTRIGTFATPIVVLPVLSGFLFYYFEKWICGFLEENKWAAPLLGVILGIGAGALMGYRIQSIV